MPQVVIVVVGGPSIERHSFDQAEIRIGRMADNDIVLHGDGVSRRHATLHVEADRVLVEDGASTGGTLLDGVRTVGPTVVNVRDQIAIGNYRLHVEPIGATEAITREREVPALAVQEAALLDALSGGDEAARGVYADWLEGHGREAEAEYLRAEEELAAIAPYHVRWDPVTGRLRQLAGLTALDWRRRVAHRALEGCELQRCPRYWSRMRSIGGDNVRICGACDRDVFYCTTLDEALRRIDVGGGVVVDAALVRSNGDLDD